MTTLTRRHLRVALVLWGAAFALTLPLSAAHAASPSLPKAAGPRLGPVYVVKVQIAHRVQFEGLTDYDVAGVKDSVATLYATREEVDSLRREGFKVLSVEEPKRVPEEPQTKAPAGWNWNVIHNHAQVTAFVQDLAAQHPDLVRVTSIGRSVQGRDIWAVKITDNPDVDEVEPEVRYVGAIHGDEVVGIEMNLRFMDLLVRYYGKSRRVTELVNETELWFIPLWNPDGREAQERYNANGYDLNRVFPNEADSVTSNVLYGPPRDLSELDAEAPEVSSFMRFSEQRRFVTGGSFHGGAVVIVYGWSSSPDPDQTWGSMYTPVPDRDLYVSLANEYVRFNGPLAHSNDFPEEVDEPAGIENSAAWYIVAGCSQDWAYKVTGMLDFDIELSEIKFPSASTIQAYWEQNQASMMALAETARWGVHGVVTDAVTGAPVHAAVKVAGFDHLMFTDPNAGDYHRPLLPGTHTLVFSAPGYVTQEVTGVVVAGRAPVWHNVRLQPASATLSHKIDFRPNDGVVLNGFLRDHGAVFGPRDNGLTYGWTASAASCMRNNSHLFSEDAAHDAYANMNGCGTPRWEMQVPNGTYRVRLVVGDPATSSSGAVNVLAEGAQALAGSISEAKPWLEGSSTIVVTDGRLTLSNGSGANANKVCSVEVTQTAPAKVRRVWDRPLVKRRALPVLPVRSGRGVVPAK